MSERNFEVVVCKANGWVDTYEYLTRIQAEDVRNRALGMEDTVSVDMNEMVEKEYFTE